MRSCSPRGYAMQIVNVCWRNLLTLLGFATYVTLGGYFVLNLPLLTDVPRHRSIGEFELVDQDGRPTTRDDLVGKPFALLFGSTGCTDTCEARLAQVSAVVQRLDGTTSDRFRVVFVGVDSERDHPKTMKAFLAAFDQRFLGLTGTKSQVKKMTRPYRPHYERSPDGLGGYRISHPSGLFLFNSGGELVEISDLPGSSSNLLTKLNALAEN